MDGNYTLGHDFIPPDGGDFMPDDEADAQLMFEYLEWRIGPHYSKERDRGTPSVSFDYEWAYQNDEALALLEPLLAELDLTLSQALGLLTKAARLERE